MLKRFCFLLLLYFAACANLLGVEVRSIDKFMDDAAFDAWNQVTNDVLFTRRDGAGIVQLFTVKADAREPEESKKCISCSPRMAIGLSTVALPTVHKGASDWHPSGEWFITQMEIPDNMSWRQMRRMPGTRNLAEPGSGWWNNLFLVKGDGSLWIRLTNFSPRDVNSGVLYPKFSRDGKMIAWAERIGGARPFDKYPLAQWQLKTANIDVASEAPKLFDIKTHPVQDGAIVEPQDWSAGNKLIFAADIGYGALPYPAYRLDLWEAEIDRDGEMKHLRNLTRTRDFFEEHAACAPDGRTVAIVANIFDRDYAKRMTEAWNRDGQRFSHFIVRSLVTDLFLMDRDGKTLKRLTRFADQDWKGRHPLVGRCAWGKDGKTLLVGLTLRSNLTGKKEREAIYRISLE